MFSFWDKFSTICNLIYKWSPKKRYRSEKGYRKDLKEYLSKVRLGNILTGYSSLNITCEQGRTRPDLLIDDKIAVELKMNLRSKTQVDRLIGQISHYVYKGYDVIVVLVGKTKEDKKRDIIRAINSFIRYNGFGTPINRIKVITPPKACSLM